MHGVFRPRLISAYLTGRSANRGACAQPCRWRYALSEETRPGEYFPVLEDAHGMTILSSRDLCAVSFLDKLATAGVTSFKIEGRMKSPYYVATVVNVYRRALDALARGETPDQAFLMKELGAASHRPFSRGFYFGEIPFESAAGDGYVQDCIFAGVVRAAESGRITFEQRNRIRTGDRLEVLSPVLSNVHFTVGSMIAPNGSTTDDARLPSGLYSTDCPLPLSPGDILRIPPLGKTSITDENAAFETKNVKNTPHVKMVALTCGVFCISRAATCKARNNGRAWQSARRACRFQQCAYPQHRESGSS